MRFSALLSAVAAVLPHASAVLNELTPPDYFGLQIEANAWTTNTSYVGYNVYQYQVSNTQWEAVLAPPIIPANFYQLVAPNKTASGTYYSLQSDYLTTPGYLTPDLLQAFWEPLLFTYDPDQTERLEQNVFYINGTKNAMYLQMREDLAFTPNGNIKYIGFQGFIGCYWSQKLPQLFFWTFYGEASPEALPSECSFYNVRVIPLEKTF